MAPAFNHKHRYYFWMVAKKGGMSRAKDKPGMAVQTVSAQMRELESSLGFALLKPAGRELVLTAAGLAAMQQADQIFQLGEDLPARVHDELLAHYPVQRLRSCDGITEHFYAIGTEKKVQHPLVQRLLQPAV